MPRISGHLPALSFNNLHMKSIDINVLIQYINNQLPGKEKRQIEIFLNKNPHYYKILKGLHNMKNNLKEGENLESYMEKKKKKLQRKLFDKQ